jgi:hypothetical protein
VLAKACPDRGNSNLPQFSSGSRNLQVAEMGVISLPPDHPLHFTCWFMKYRGNQMVNNLYHEVGCDGNGREGVST